MKSKKYAALYVRVSTDAQREEGYSIEAQCEMLKAYCTAKEIQHYELFIDGGYSGSNIDRPSMTRMIKEIREGKISHVIVYKLDRLSRSQKDTLYLIEDVLNPNGVSFVSLNENMDTSTPIGRAMLGIISAFAQLERETIKDRTRMGMKERVKNGYWMGGGHVPFGYDYDSSRGILVPNKDSEKVRLMYKLYIEGYSMMRIAKTLGMKYERMVEQIIKRKTNIGYISYKGKDYKGLHEAIVGPEVYYKAMEIYRQRSKNGLTSATNLLSGLLVCGVCGAKMRYQKWGKSGYKIYCYSQDSGKPHLHKSENCDNYKLWADEVEDIVINDLFLLAHKKYQSKGKGEDEENYLKALYKRKEGSERKLQRLYQLYALGTDDSLMKVIEDTKSEVKNTIEEISKYEEQSRLAQKQSDTINDLRDLKSAWKYMSFMEKQSLVRKCIDKIVITKEKIEVFYLI